MLNRAVYVFVGLWLPCFIQGQASPQPGAKMTFADHGHSYAYIDDVGFSRDGNMALTASAGTITTWKLDTGNWFYKINVPRGGIISAVFLPDNQRVAAGSGPLNKHIRIWTIDTSTPEVEIPIDMAKVNDGIVAIAINRDGTLLAAATRYNAIHLIDIRSKKVIDVLRVHKEGSKRPRSSLAFSPDGRFLASAGGHDATAVIFDVEQRKVVHRLAADDGVPLKYVAWSHDGKVLATGGTSRQIVLWNAESGRYITRFDCGIGIPRGLAFSPKDEVLAIVAGGIPLGQIAFYSPTTKQVVMRYGHAKGIECLAFSPDGKLLITGGADKTAKVWDVPKLGPGGVRGGTGSVPCSMTR